MKFFKDKKGLKWLKYILLGGLFIKLAGFIFKNDKLKKIGNNFNDFLESKKKKLKNWQVGNKALKNTAKIQAKFLKIILFQMTITTLNRKF